MLGRRPQPHEGYDANAAYEAGRARAEYVASGQADRDEAEAVECVKNVVMVTAYVTTGCHHPKVLAGLYGAVAAVTGLVYAGSCVADTYYDAYKDKDDDKEVVRIFSGIIGGFSAICCSLSSIRALYEYSQEPETRIEDSRVVAEEGHTAEV